MFAQLVAVVLAGNPEAVTLDVGERPTVTVSTIHGSVDLRREGSGPVKIQAELPERGDYPDAWIFEVRGEGERVTAKVCCGKCEGRSHRECSKGPIKITGTMPEAASLELSCVSSEVKVQGGSGRVQISTVSGPIDVRRTRGEVAISSVSAEVTVAPSRTRETSVSTVSGDVQLQLPQSDDAQIRFSTMSGRGPDRSQLGEGRGAEVAVSTLSGDLKVRKTSER